MGNFLNYARNSSKTMRNLKIAALLVVFASISNAAFANLIIDLNVVSINGIANPTPGSIYPSE